MITELKIKNITTIDAAYEFLPKFIKQYNSKFALPINYITSIFEPMSNIDDIYNMLAVRAPRIINSGSCINFEFKTYYPAIDGERKYFDHRTKALVFRTLDNNLYVTIGDQIYNMVELPKNLITSKKFNIKTEVKKKKNVYRPPMGYPQKQNSF